jgi:hypothetical protein
VSTPNPLPVISLHSRKGGAGKTTLALWIASELAEKGPVVLIDADVVGTEVADLFCDSDDGFWTLGLMELMTQSTGGNAAFESYLTATLKTQDLWTEPGMPAIWLGDEEIRLMPSSRCRSIEHRREADRELARRFLVLDFAREQIHRRFLTLLRVLKKETPDLQAIVIDNSPFHVGLAELTSDLADTAPVGLKKEHDEFWESARLIELSVVGPDLQDMVASISDLDDEGTANRKRGFIVNRDEHVAVLSGDPDHALSQAGGCRALTALPDSGQRVLRSQRVAHVGLSSRLSSGWGAIYPDLSKDDVKYPQALTFDEVLTSSWAGLQRERWEKDSFKSFSRWQDFFNGL